MINNDLNWSAIRQEYVSKGWVTVKNILSPDAAENIASVLTSMNDWELYCSGCERKKPVIYSENDFKALSPKKKAEIAQTLQQVAKTRYAFYFYQHSLHDTPHALLREFYESLAKEKCLGFIRYITGELVISNIVASATVYRPGCFLRTHCDTGGNKDRLFAFVFNFTRDWNPDWGGLLNFVDEKRNPTATIKPEFNTLTLFKVPVDHFVSLVASYATIHRHAITGWYMQPPPADTPG